QPPPGPPAARTPQEPVPIPPEGAPPALDFAPTPVPAVADEKGPLPPLPSADELAAVRGLMSLDMLRATLLERFPDDFGGLVADGDGFAILTTGRQAEIEAFVEDFSADLMTDHEVAVAPPAFSYATARHSLRSLRDLM